MADQKRWIVTTSGDRSIHDISNDLRTAGFNVGDVLEEVGSITGAAGEDALTRIRSIKGVVDVSPDLPIDVGPPDSPETW